MSSKTEVLSKIQSNSQYLGSYVKELIGSIHCENSPTKPTVYKRGDVTRVRIQADGSSKPRPSVIFKVTKDYVLSIPLTTSEDHNVLCVSTGSRFFKEGWFCNIYIVTPIERVEFIGIYDNMKSLNNVVKELRLFINHNI